VILRVTDTGRGIPPAFLPHVFEPFRQAEAATSRRTGGLGLGLAIVRQLVERHGGRVEAESAGDGQGATFTVVLPATSARDVVVPALPLEPSSNGDGVAARPDGPPLAGHRVLVVEDDVCTQEALALIVSDAGATVRTAGSTREGLAILCAWRPHIVLCDIGLPGEDGYTFVRDLRAMPATEGGMTPAVAFTAYAQASDRARALDAGFQSHVAKPVDPPELIRVLVTTVQPSTPTTDVGRNGTAAVATLPETAEGVVGRA
jgi:CheY-like chemotaxis protein